MITREIDPDALLERLANIITLRQVEAHPGCCDQAVTEVLEILSKAIEESLDNDPGDWGVDS